MIKGVLVIRIMLVLVKRKKELINSILAGLQRGLNLNLLVYSMMNL